MGGYKHIQSADRTTFNIALNTDFTFQKDGWVQFGGYASSKTTLQINGVGYYTIYGGNQAGFGVTYSHPVNKGDVVKIVGTNADISNIHVGWYVE